MKPEDIVVDGYYQGGQCVYKVVRKYFLPCSTDFNEQVAYKCFSMNGDELLNSRSQHIGLNTFASAVARRVKPK